MVLQISDSSVFSPQLLTLFSIYRPLSLISEPIFLNVLGAFSRSIDEPEDAVEGVGVLGARPKTRGDLGDEAFEFGELGIEMISSWIGIAFE